MYTYLSSEQNLSHARELIIRLVEPHRIVLYYTVCVVDLILNRSHLSHLLSLSPNLECRIPRPRTQGITLWIDTQTRYMLFMRLIEGKGRSGFVRQGVKGQNVRVRMTSK